MATRFIFGSPVQKRVVYQKVMQKSHVSRMRNDRSQIERFQYLESVAFEGVFCIGPQICLGGLADQPGRCARPPAKRIGWPDLPRDVQATRRGAEADVADAIDVITNNSCVKKRMINLLEG
jgi:hypothetical protein